MLTRNDFAMFAQIITGIEDMGKRREFAELIANYCSKNNSRFSRVKFLTACGLMTDYEVAKSSFEKYINDTDLELAT